MLEERYLLTKAKLLFQLFDGLTGIIVGRRPTLAAVALKRGKQLKFSSFCGKWIREIASAELTVF